MVCQVRVRDDIRSDYCLRVLVHVLVGLLGESAVSSTSPVVNLKGIEKLVQEVMGKGP